MDGALRRHTWRDPRRHGEMDNTSICSVSPTETCCQHLDTTTSEGSDANITLGTGYELNLVDTHFRNSSDTFFRHCHYLVFSLSWFTLFTFWTSHLPVSSRVLHVSHVCDRRDRWQSQQPRTTCAWSECRSILRNPSGIQDVKLLIGTGSSRLD